MPCTHAPTHSCTHALRWFFNMVVIFLSIFFVPFQFAFQDIPGLWCVHFVRGSDIPAFIFYVKSTPGICVNSSYCYVY